MRARYSALLTARYQALKRQTNIDLDQQCLWQAIYPRIMASIKKGETRTTFAGEILPGVRAILIAQGYTVMEDAPAFLSSTPRTIIDWSYEMPTV